MKLAILSVSPRCYSTRRLMEAARQRGHVVRVLNTLKFALELQHARRSLGTQAARVQPAREADVLAVSKLRRPAVPRRSSTSSTQRTPQASTECTPCCST